MDENSRCDKNEFDKKMSLMTCWDYIQWSREIHNIGRLVKPCATRTSLDESYILHVCDLCSLSFSALK